ncbi:MAG: Crp/Fnr family transcriptional regulator [Gammaproteobacteria bacterium]|nr:Crp/Fnr family transcriptional regulator [Gammaproteobacteria bacterium]MBU1444054.1 Crp/Fnr family transcriptional regulator [Gammaproteobacteria bacterium]
MDPSARSFVALRQVFLLAELPDAKLESVSRRCQWRVLPARRFLMHRSDPRREVLFIVSGAARVTSYSDSGRQVSFRDVGAGDCVGVLAALDGEPRSADVVSTEPCVLATLSNEEFDTLLRAEPVVARAVMVHLSALVRQASARLIELSTQDVQSRLRFELLRRAESARKPGETAVRLKQFPSHEIVASLISTGREQVTRELNKLIRDGLIRKDGQALVITDVAELRGLVQSQEAAPVDLTAIRSVKRDEGTAAGRGV